MGLFRKKEKLSKEEAARKSADARTNKFLTEPTPYRFSSSFFMHNGRYATILKLYVRQGSNRQLSYMDILDFVPTSTMTDVEAHLIVDDRLIHADEKDKLITKNSTTNLVVIKDDENREQKKQNAGKAEETQNVKEARTSERDDYLMYQSIIGKSEAIAVYRWSLLIIGNSMEIVDEQIRQLNTRLSKVHDGALWDSLPGEQQDRFKALFGTLPLDRFAETTTSGNYAGLNLAMSAGLLDDNGIPVGKDVFSPAQSTAFFDFENSTQSQAMIAMPKSSSIPFYRHERSQDQISASSIIAQAAANHIVMAGHRAHHIVLNEFDYFMQNTFYRPAESVDIFKHYDVMDVTINLMQGFGEFSDLHNVYSRLIRKIVNVFNIMRNLELSEADEVIIMKALQQFYDDQKLWSSDADIYPERTLILGIRHPEAYVTAASFINTFTSLSKKASMESKFTQADRIDTLAGLLGASLDMYRSVIGRTTSIEQTDAIQVYYDYSRIQDTVLKQIQFVNMIEYIVHTAAPGDVIVLHGYDQVYSAVSDMVLDTIESAKKRGIRFIFAFDTISSFENARKIDMNDMFKMQSRYYVDLDIDVSWSIIGRVLPDEIDKIRNALNTELSGQIIANLQTKLENQALVHRAIGNVNNFVQFNPII